MRRILDDIGQTVALVVWAGIFVGIMLVGRVTNR